MQKIENGEVDKPVGYLIALRAGPDLSLIAEKVKELGACLKIERLSVNRNVLAICQVSGQGKDVIQALNHIKKWSMNQTPVVWLEEIKKPKGGAGSPPESRFTTAALCRILGRPISSLDIPAAVKWELRDQGISTVGDLVRMEEIDLWLLSSVREDSFERINQVLAEMGLRLGTALPPPTF